jgi:hypothetical protein
MSQPEASAVALSILADRTVTTACELLARVGIEVAVIKGALWQHTLYDRPGERTFSDVDLLVLPRDFKAASRALEQGDFVAQATPQGSHEQAHLHPDLPLAIDLHQSLFARFRYRLPTAELWRRATRDERLFGRRVLLPHPLDQLANLIGHFASNHAPATSTEQTDFARLVSRLALEPSEAARHLTAVGLTRAALFAMPELESEESASFVRTCLGALPRDPLGRYLAEIARIAMHRGGRYAPGLAPLAHGLNASLAHTVRSLGEASLRVAQQRLRGERSPTLEAPVLARREGHPKP